MVNPMSKVLGDDSLLVEMMDPSPIPQRGCVDAKRLRCSAPLDDPVSKVLFDDYTSSLPAPVPPLDDENLLQEILIRLPPQPSSLPRASLVCVRWRSILSNPNFIKRFRKHHRKPPLLGFFGRHVGNTNVFTPTLEPPDCIPAARFSVPWRHRRELWRFMGCRHGLAILINDYQREIVVWDPLTGQQHHVPFPLWLCNSNTEIVSPSHATVLCADAEDGHVHGDCISSPFRLVLIFGRRLMAFACLYDSASGVWGDTVSTVSTHMVHLIRPSVLTGNTLYWLFSGGDILAFDIECQTLFVIEKPVDAHRTGCWSCQPLRTDEGSGLGLAVMSKLSIQLWKRKSNCNGVVRWVLMQKSIQLEDMFPQRMPRDDNCVHLAGYDEVTNVIVLSTRIGKFMLQLESMQIGKISERNDNDNCFMECYPYTNFYTAGKLDGNG